ncbi:Hsp33 family molecular chaperone HslO [Gimibacter soli]|uniref:Hsp33 family molecular chaperone HslO n=1 Tax=Gimibacter soli TaxID=3024400 RepID=A0AAF0BHZ8_9PROT|nr:Hsp33 family molecular chaperone HslO [Gimibacter soli]WCL54793.1 Hsp33 family molecular chaperone HslO [Gimibacter soli]
MNDKPIVIKDPDFSRDNEIRPFQIEGMDVRGRAVRLGTVADQILVAHGYPEPVERIVGEMAALAGLLGSILKFDGIVTVQTKSQGPIPMMVADYERKADGTGHIRACAEIDHEKLSTFGANPSFKGLIGSKNGYLVITIDQGADMERYQGIVELKGDSLSDVIHAYFESSEQTPTAVRLAADRDPVSGHWRAGGIMVQHLARGETGRERILDRETEEHWNRASTLMHSVKESELLDPALTLDDLLYRLYNEDGVRVFDATRVQKGCRCERERLLAVLGQFSADDKDHMVVDGKIAVNCQFCNKTFDFSPEEVG